MSCSRRVAVTLRANEVNFAGPTSSRRLRAVSVLSSASTEGTARKRSLLAWVFFNVFAKPRQNMLVWACEAIGKKFIDMRGSQPLHSKYRRRPPPAPPALGDPKFVPKDNKLIRLARE